MIDSGIFQFRKGLSRIFANVYTRRHFRTLIAIIVGVALTLTMSVVFIKLSPKAEAEDEVSYKASIAPFYDFQYCGGQKWRETPDGFLKESGASEEYDNCLAMQTYYDSMYGLLEASAYISQGRQNDYDDYTNILNQLNETYTQVGIEASQHLRDPLFYEDEWYKMSDDDQKQMQYDYYVKSLDLYKEQLLSYTSLQALHKKLYRNFFDNYDIIEQSLLEGYDYNVEFWLTDCVAKEEKHNPDAESFCSNLFKKYVATSEGLDINNSSDVTKLEEVLNEATDLETSYGEAMSQVGQSIANIANLDDAFPVLEQLIIEGNYDLDADDVEKLNKISFDTSEISNAKNILNSGLLGLTSQSGYGKTEDGKKLVYSVADNCKDSIHGTIDSQKFAQCFGVAGEDRLSAPKISLFNDGKESESAKNLVVTDSQTASLKEIVDTKNNPQLVTPQLLISDSGIKNFALKISLPKHFDDSDITYAYKTDKTGDTVYTVSAKESSPKLVDGNITEFMAIADYSLGIVFVPSYVIKGSDGVEHKGTGGEWVKAGANDNIKYLKFSLDPRQDKLAMQTATVQDGWSSQKIYNNSNDTSSHVLGSAAITSLPIDNITAASTATNNSIIYTGTYANIGLGKLDTNDIFEEYKVKASAIPQALFDPKGPCSDGPNHEYFHYMSSGVSVQNGLTGFSSETSFHSDIPVHDQYDYGSACSNHMDGFFGQNGAAFTNQNSLGNISYGNSSHKRDSDKRHQCDPENAYKISHSYIEYGHTIGDKRTNLRQVGYKFAEEKDTSKYSLYYRVYQDDGKGAGYWSYPAYDGQLAGDGEHYIYAIEFYVTPTNGAQKVIPSIKAANMLLTEGYTAHIEVAYRNADPSSNNATWIYTGCDLGNIGQNQRQQLSLKDCKNGNSVGIIPKGSIVRLGYNVNGADKDEKKSVRWSEPFFYGGTDEEIDKALTIGFTANGSIQSNDESDVSLISAGTDATVNSALDVVAKKNKEKILSITLFALGIIISIIGVVIMAVATAGLAIPVFIGFVLATIGFALIIADIVQQVLDASILTIPELDYTTLPTTDRYGENKKLPVIGGFERFSHGMYCQRSSVHYVKPDGASGTITDEKYGTSEDFKDTGCNEGSVGGFSNNYGFTYNATFANLPDGTVVNLCIGGKCDSNSFIYEQRSKQTAGYAFDGTAAARRLKLVAYDSPAVAYSKIKMWAAEAADLLVSSAAQIAQDILQLVMMVAEIAAENVAAKKAASRLRVKLEQEGIDEAGLTNHESLRRSAPMSRDEFAELNRDVVANRAAQEKQWREAFGRLQEQPGRMKAIQDQIDRTAPEGATSGNRTLSRLFEDTQLDGELFLGADPDDPECFAQTTTYGKDKDGNYRVLSRRQLMQRTGLSEDDELFRAGIAGRKNMRDWERMRSMNEYEKGIQSSRRQLREIPRFNFKGRGGDAIDAEVSRTLGILSRGSGPISALTTSFLAGVATGAVLPDIFAHLVAILSKLSDSVSVLSSSYYSSTSVQNSVHARTLAYDNKDYSNLPSLTSGIDINAAEDGKNIETLQAVLKNVITPPLSKDAEGNEMESDFAYTGDNIGEQKLDSILFVIGDYLAHFGIYVDHFDPDLISTAKKIVDSQGADFVDALIHQTVTDKKDSDHHTDSVDASNANSLLSAVTVANVDTSKKYSSVISGVSPIAVLNDVVYGKIGYDDKDNPITSIMKAPVVNCKQNDQLIAECLIKNVNAEEHIYNMDIVDENGKVVGSVSTGEIAPNSEITVKLNLPEVGKFRITIADTWKLWYSFVGHPHASYSTQTGSTYTYVINAEYDGESTVERTCDEGFTMQGTDLCVSNSGERRAIKEIVHQAPINLTFADPAFGLSVPNNEYLIPTSLYKAYLLNESEKDFNDVKIDGEINIWGQDYTKVKTSAISIANSQNKVLKADDSKLNDSEAKFIDFLLNGDKYILGLNSGLTVSSFDKAVGIVGAEKLLNPPEDMKKSMTYINCKDLTNTLIVGKSVDCQIGTDRGKNDSNYEIEVTYPKSTGFTYKLSDDDKDRLISANTIDIEDHEQTTVLKFKADTDFDKLVIDAAFTQNALQVGENDFGSIYSQINGSSPSFANGVSHFNIYDAKQYQVFLSCTEGDYTSTTVDCKLENPGDKVLLYLLNVKNIDDNSVWSPSLDALSAKAIQAKSTVGLKVDLKALGVSKKISVATGVVVDGMKQLADNLTATSVITQQAYHPCQSYGPDWHYVASSIGFGLCQTGSGNMVDSMPASEKDSKGEVVPVAHVSFSN